MSNFKDVKNEAQQKTHDAIKDAIDITSSVYETVKENAESLANQVQETVSEYYSEGKKKAEQAYDATIEQKDTMVEIIKENPLASVLVAAGIGYLISRLRSK